jgi:hypothetical protein
MSAALRPSQLRLSQPERIVVHLTEEAKATLDRMAQTAGLSKTDQVNKALSIYRLIEAQLETSEPDVSLARFLKTKDESVELRAPKDSPPVKPEADPAAARRLILLIALMWLLAFGLPVVESQFPLTDQAITTNEFATVALALAVTWRAIDKHRKLAAGTGVCLYIAAPGQNIRFCRCGRG